MPLDNPQPGTGWAAEFQSAALPWVTSSTASSVIAIHSFNFVSRFLYLMNAGTSTDKIAYAFTSNGLKAATANFGVLLAGQSINVDIRALTVYVSASQGTPQYTLLAGLTTVPKKFMPTMTGSDGWGGIG